MTPALAGPDIAGVRPGTQLKLGLTKTMINNARQLSRSLVSIYHYPETRSKRFGGRPFVGERPGPWVPQMWPWALGRRRGKTTLRCLFNHNRGSNYVAGLLRLRGAVCNVTVTVTKVFIMRFLLKDRSALQSHYICSAKPRLDKTVLRRFKMLSSTGGVRCQ